VSREARVVAGLVAAGTVGRLVLAFTTFGLHYDIESFRIVDAALHHDPLAVYATGRWPYPPGYFGFVEAAHVAARLTGAPFHGWIQVPSVLADAGLGALVWVGLRSAAATPRVRLAGVALVTLGPSFWLISGYHGQIDAVAILPALAALLVWERGRERRALAAGLLVGLGAAVKTFPLLMLLPLLPSARSHRERAVLVGAAVAVPLLALAPWLAAHGHDAVHALRAYHGLPGFGGATLLVEPGLGRSWVDNGIVTSVGAPARWLWDHQQLLVGLAALAAAAIAWRTRLEVRVAAALVWLAVTVADTTQTFQYYVWLLPVLLVAGELRLVALVQALLLVPALQLYFGWATPGLDWLYPLGCDLALLVLAVALVARARRLRHP